MLPVFFEFWFDSIFDRLPFLTHIVIFFGSQSDGWFLLYPDHFVYYVNIIWVLFNF